MIHFACKTCGKPLAWQEDAAGALVFCACGQGNRVPQPDEPSVPSVSNPWVDLVQPSQPEPTPARDSSHCFNHPDELQEQTCDTCGEAFCAACLVTFQERRVCGPCKNFQLRVLQRPSSISGLAVTSLVLTLALGLCGHFLVLIGGSSRQSGFAFCGVVPQFVALVVGIMAVREVETKPRTSGRALAMTGLLTAFVVCVELILLGIVIYRQGE